MNRCHFWNRKSISSVSERRRSPQPFSSLPIEYLCVCSEQHLMLQSRMTGFQNQGPHHWFPGYVLKTPLPCTISRTTLLVFNVTCHSHWTCPLITTHTHCSSQTSRIGFKEAVLLGCWCNTDSCPKGCWSWAQLIQCRRQTKQGAAISWKLHAAVGGWSSSTVWTGHSYVLISYLSF